MDEDQGQVKETVQDWQDAFYMLRLFRQIGIIIKAHFIMNREKLMVKLFITGDDHFGKRRIAIKIYETNQM